MKNIALFLLAFALPLLGFGQNQPNALALKVQSFKTQKAAFQKATLFQFAGEAKTTAQFDEMVDGGQLLTLDLAALKSVYQANLETIELSLPNGSNKPLLLELVRHQLLTEDFSVVTSTSDGQPIDYQPGIYYRGIVKGDPSSLAAVSVFEDEIIGVISTAETGNMVLGKTNGTAKSPNYIFYKEDDLLLDYSFSCEAGDDAVSEGKKPHDLDAEKVAKCVRAYLECEYALVTEKGGATGATNYITGLFNVVATLYQNEAITTYISQIFTWTTADPYATSSTSAALTSFRNYRSTYNGDVAHLISRGAPTGGGIAWVDALCTSYAYAYSYINSTYQQFPTYSWSVNVIAHEMGHNLGSPHTHACAWNNNNTAIDGCGPAVGANEGCNAPLPTGGGTMMSYCHLVSGVGINFNLGFGPQPGDKIRNEVTGAACLVVCAAPCVTIATSGNSVNCFGGSNGTATATPTGGTAPYTYAWSNGGNTQTISNLAAGTYTVTITTATGCTGTAARIVTQPTALGTSTTVTNTSNGQNNGAINLTVSGGTPAYSYLWSNGANTEDISGLAPGTYTVTVTDSKGCTATRSATVLNGGTAPMTLSFIVTNASNGQNNGAINLTVSGGTAPYSYLWSNGAQTQDLVNIPAGTYTVTVTPATGSTATGSATVGTNSSGCTIVNLPHTQSFETGLGSWSQATNDQMDWTLLSGSTPSASTGPDLAANGSFYAYTEATNNTNKIAYLLSPCFNITGVTGFQTSFNYHMYGSQMGTLRFQYSLNGGTSWTNVWTKNNNQGNSWKTQSVTFTNNGGTSIRFRFYGKTGGEKSDMAIDNFTIIATGNLPGGTLDAATVVLGSAGAESAGLTLSPNPVDVELTVSYHAAAGQTGKIMVSDQMGRVVKTEMLEDVEGQNEHLLYVADLLPGLYFLTVEEGPNRRVERFVVLR